MKDEVRYEHNSFGMVGITNTSCNRGISMFGSSIRHNRFITLRIHRADMFRHLHTEWYHATEPIVEIMLSAAQFTQFITSPNQGDGVPCTISYIGREEMDQCPYYGQNEVFAAELKDDFKKAMIDADTLAENAKDLLQRKGNLKVSEKEELLSQINMLCQHVKANMPFLHKQFIRSMNKTVNAAKIEIEGFYNSTVMRLGKKALAKLNAPKLPRIEK